MACEEFMWAYNLHSGWYDYYDNLLQPENVDSYTDEELGRMYREMLHHKDLAKKAKDKVEECRPLPIPAPPPLDRAARPFPEAYWHLRPQPIPPGIEQPVERIWKYGIRYPFPWPPKCGPWTRKMMGEFVKDPKKVLALSNAITKQFKALDLDLGENLTFACRVCIVEKPTSLREVRAVETRLLGFEPESPITMIFEPAIMKKVVDEVNKTKIDYRDEPLFFQPTASVADN